MLVFVLPTCSGKRETEERERVSGRRFKNAPSPCDSMKAHVPMTSMVAVVHDVLCVCLPFCSIHVIHMTNVPPGHPVYHLQCILQCSVCLCVHIIPSSVKGFVVW